MDSHDDMANIAGMILRLRRQRRDALPEPLFGEIAWEMLLHLFVADAQGERRTARQFAAETGNSLETTSRWLRFLSDEALVVGDGDGNLDDFLTLAPAAITAIEGYVADLGAVIRETMGEARSTRPD